MYQVLINSTSLAAARRDVEDIPSVTSFNPLGTLPPSCLQFLLWLTLPGLIPTSMSSYRSPFGKTWTKFAPGPLVLVPWRPSFVSDRA